MSDLKSWYAGLNQREKTMVSLLGVALAILLLMLLVIMPLKNYQSDLRQERDVLKSQLGDLTQQVAALQGGGRVVSNLALNQLINSTAKTYGLKFSSIQERKRNKEIQLRLDDAHFDKLVRWISDLEQKNGLIIENLRVSDTDTVGKVDVSLKVLKAG